MLDSAGIDSRRFSLRGKKWRYRGEGNANLVLALPLEHKIVRLRKCDGAGSNEPEEVLAERDREHVWREAVFCRGIMVPLLGNAYIQPPTAARMDRAEVKVLDQAVRMHRPSHRHHKSLQFGFVTVYPDYALLPIHLSAESVPVFCVEVKPKQGWVPMPDRRMPKCTFCMNQYLKMKHRSIASHSRYCPLDLFSGNRTRMTQALRALIAAPQNNLKIFKDGTLVYGEELNEDLHAVLASWLGESLGIGKLVDKLCYLVLEALTRDLTGRDKLSDSETDESDTDNMAVWERGCQSLLRPTSLPNGARTPSLAMTERIPSALVAAVTPLLPGPFCDWNAEPLGPDCILGRILRVQKLDHTGADRVYETYRRKGGTDYGYVAGPGLSPLHRYLLATTAKDCSIMMAFQRLPEHDYRVPEHHVVRDPDGQAFAMNVGVSDLDPKPLSCIEKHRKRDCEVLAACLEFLRPKTENEADGRS
ncbi:hypothetical protein C0J52_00612 [Blattella germanica]|nr:hypothetical protein C0J52_00612 [Blattella germanica]